MTHLRYIVRFEVNPPDHGRNSPKGDIQRLRPRIDLLFPNIFGVGVKIDPAFVSKLLADESEPIGALGQLSNFWSPRVSVDGAGKIEGLSPPEHATQLFLWYYGEVGNGGHSQYLLNPTGAYARETLTALQEMGLTDVADALESVIALFPGQSIPKERVSRAAVLEAMDGEGSDAPSVFARADRTLWAIPIVPLHIRVVRYLSEHRADVLQPEQT